MNSLTKHFEKIDLEDTGKVRLMNRIDRKFWFHVSDLAGMLAAVQHDYFVLAIDGREQSVYSTTYYDTPVKTMYISHHNGKLHRFKIRHRTYVDTNLRFLEIKVKTNKGRTIKHRMISDSGSGECPSAEKEFIQTHTPFLWDELTPGLTNTFTRITLINKEMNERCTIDRDIHFMAGLQVVDLHNLVVLEIKTEGRSRVSPLAKALEGQRIRPSGFSKYCMGLMLTDSGVKHNAFKQKKHRLDRLI